jgi:tetratricopeptide (TPR) repeat protein
VPARLVLTVLGLALAGSVAADTVVLVDGRSLETDRAWYEGPDVRYRRGGTLYSLPRQLVARLEPSAANGEILGPEVESSRERLAAGDAQEALRFARLAVFHDPRSAPALEALAAAQLALKDARQASTSAEAALQIDPRRARTLEILGDALAALGDGDAARRQYRLSLGVRDEPRVREKIQRLGPPAALVSTARFRIRYHGSANEPLGLAVLKLLDDTWDEYERTLGFSPDLPVTVVLQTDAAFRDTTRAPGWAAGWNDGTIRVPVQGIGRPTAGLVRVLRHELAHSFLASRIGPTCPTWLHEGIAQWLEGGDPAREDRGLVAVARGGRMLELQSLEGPFSDLSEQQATAAYAQSLSAVAHLLRLGGREGLRAFLAALATGQTPAAALKTAYGLGYAELQSRWEAYLKGRPASGRAAAAGG